jgi:hypothetical protein
MKKNLAQAALLIAFATMASSAHARTFSAPSRAACEKELKAECRKHQAEIVVDDLDENAPQWTIREGGITVGNADYSTSSGEGLCTINLNDGQ